MRVNPFPLPVIPVLDIQNGTVVRAVAGDRAAYQPIETPLCDGSAPVDVAKALLHSTGANALYVADLDAIEGGAIDSRTLEHLLSLETALRLDAGVRTLDDATDIDQRLRVKMPIASRVVVGTETLAGRGDLPRIIEILGASRVSVSIDLRDGAIIAAEPKWRSATPLSVIEDVVRFGAASLIVLDLARVGVAEGPPNCELLAEIRRRYPAIELHAGGGVRGIRDLESLAKAGCDGALVASWLHRRAR